MSSAVPKGGVDELEEALNQAHAEADKLANELQDERVPGWQQ